MLERKQSLELKKHVAVIHSSNKLSLLQRKIANALLFNAYDELLEKDEHAIHISTLCKLIGYDSNDHKTIKKALVNLLSTVLEWNLVDGNRLDTEGVWNASSIIADASIDGAVCTYSYSNKMKKLLHRPELYGRLNMVVQAMFQSSYGLALYENCIRFQNIEQTPWFDIVQFRKLMGVEDGKYKIFRDFKSRVLDKAIEEVNKYSPITVVPQYQKVKRQVVAIQFQIKPNDEAKQALPSETNKTLSQLLKDTFGLSKKQIEDVMSHYEEEYIRDKMTLIEHSSSFSSGKISNLAKYLICALKEDYQPAKSSKNVLSMKRKPQETRTEVNRSDDYHRYQNKQIMAIYKKQTKPLQKLILSDLIKHLGKGIYYDIYVRDGLKNILIQDQLCMLMRQKYAERLVGVMSYEEFVRSMDKVCST